MKDFEDKYSKGLYTETVAQTKYQELQKLDQELNNYGVTKEQELAQEASKVQTLISDELIVMNNKINDAINTFIQKYRAEKGYAMILINQSDADKTDKAMILNSLVLAADPSLDVTADVLAGLNAEYNAAK
jgi:Skp family chaperone for outer membrane proteins